MKGRIDLRQYARGQNCQIRIPGICNRDPATTVLAHIRMPGTGIGRKPHDLIGAESCSACHDAVDGRVKTGLDTQTLRLYHLEGMARTIDMLARDGKI